VRTQADYAAAWYIRLVGMAETLFQLPPIQHDKEFTLRHLLVDPLPSYEHMTHGSRDTQGEKNAPVRHDRIAEGGLVLGRQGSATMEDRHSRVSLQTGFFSRAIDFATRIVN
jgi:hypothetical protein